MVAITAVAAHTKTATLHPNRQLHVSGGHHEEQDQEPRAGIRGDAWPAGCVHPNRVGPRLALEPVSYTHLRAHETVLDIVCRLLLEKTKLICRHMLDQK